MNEKYAATKHQIVSTCHIKYVPEIYTSEQHISMTDTNQIVTF